MLNSYSSTLTTKGQVTIPAPFRKKMGLKAGQKIIFTEKVDDIVIQSHDKLIEDLRGSLKPKIKIKYSDRKADEAIGRMFAEEYAKTR